MRKSTPAQKNLIEEDVATGPLDLKSELHHGDVSPLEHAARVEV
jgi:hypothetical protein